jgi:hypothetical protein
MNTRSGINKALCDGMKNGNDDARRAGHEFVEFDFIYFDYFHMTYCFRSGRALLFLG